MHPQHSQGLQESLEAIGQKLGEFLASSSKSRLISPSQVGLRSREEPWVADTQCLRKIHGASAAQPGTKSGFCISHSCRGTLESRKRRNTQTPTVSTIRCQYMFRGRKVKVHVRFPWAPPGPPERCLTVEAARLTLSYTGMTPQTC